MLVPDVNVLINADNEQSAAHQAARDWIEGAGNGREALAIPEMVLFGFVRITTNPEMKANVLGTESAFGIVEVIREMPAFHRLFEGARHWDIFRELSAATGIQGGGLTDAYLAAFAIENDATFVTFDRGFSKFPGLKILNPLD